MAFIELEDDDPYRIGDLELIGSEDVYDDEIDEILDMIEGDGYDDDEDDEVGFDEDDDEIGRRSRRRRRRPGRRRGRLKKQLGRVIAQRRAPAPAPATRRTAVARPRPAPQAVPVPRETRGRVLLLGGSERSISGGQLLIPTTVQELCRVDRLFIVGVDSEGGVLNPAMYLIGDIKVGTKSQFAALPPLPGTMFTQDATGQGYSLKLDTIQTGTDFTVIIANAQPGSTFTWGAYATSLR